MVQELGGFLIVAAAFNAYQLVVAFSKGQYVGVQWNAVFIVFMMLAVLSIPLPLIAHSWVLKMPINL